jgi:hypothetical protein
MADEEIKTEEVVETPEETVEPTDKKEGILDYIKGALRGKETVAEEVEDSTESNDSYERTTEVPGEFLEAAKADGWTDIDVEEFAAKYSDEELIELLPHLLEKEEEEVEDTAEEPAAAKDDDLEALKSSMKKEFLQEVLKELGPQLESLTEFQEEQEDRQMVDTFETANKIFDEASKDFPVFGETSKMPTFKSGPRKGQLIPTSQEFKTRSEVFQLATDLMRIGRSDSIENAMDDALAWYRGRYGQKETERKVIRNLKKQESKLSGARTGKETKKEFDTTRDEIVDHIRSLQKAAGIDA